jgi:hypothetical protein
MAKHDPKTPQGNPQGDGQWNKPLPKETEPGKHAKPEKPDDKDKR